MPDRGGPRQRRLGPLVGSIGRHDMHTSHTLTIDIWEGQLTWSAYSIEKDDPSDQGVVERIGGVGQLAPHEHEGVSLALLLNWVAVRLMETHRDHESHGWRRTG